ncbi:hypothetical protein [Adlercreutzia sp. ZJ154]|uniref:hypothetical protein n=1 Tax=Adlercreutzia sp. ZJ154 TaxID=2709790 RepID=UPI0013EC5113|nr:hypothetical protein [Adlercreutzia sp. ZJ154]
MEKEFAMKCFTKKILSVFVAVALCVGMVPIIANASTADGLDKTADEQAVDDSFGSVGGNSVEETQQQIDEFAASPSNAGSTPAGAEKHDQISTTAYIAATELGFRFTQISNDVVFTGADTETLQFSTEGASLSGDKYLYSYVWYVDKNDGAGATEITRASTFDGTDKDGKHTFELPISSAGMQPDDVWTYWLEVTNDAGSLSKTLNGEADTRRVVSVSYNPELRTQPLYWNKTDRQDATEDNYIWKAEGNILKESILDVDEVAASKEMGDFATGLDAVITEGSVWLPKIVNDSEKDVYSDTLALTYDISGYAVSDDGASGASILDTVSALSDKSPENIAKTLDAAGVHLLWQKDAETSPVLASSDASLDGVQYVYENAVSGKPARVVAVIGVPAGAGRVFGTFALTHKVVKPSEDDVAFTFTPEVKVEGAAEDAETDGNVVLPAEGYKRNLGATDVQFTMHPNISAEPPYYVSNVAIFKGGAGAGGAGTGGAGGTEISLTPEQLTIQGNVIKFAKLSREMFGLDADDISCNITVQVTFAKKAVAPENPDELVDVEIIKTGEEPDLSQVMVLVGGAEVAPKGGSGNTYQVPKDGAFQLSFNTDKGKRVESVTATPVNPDGSLNDADAKIYTVDGDNLSISNYSTPLQITVNYVAGTIVVPQHTVSVMQAGDTNPVALSAGSVNGGTGPFTVKNTDNITLNAAPNLGYEITGAKATFASGNIVNYSAEEAPSITLLNVVEDVEVVYSFRALDYKIDVVVDGNSTPDSKGNVSGGDSAGDIVATMPSVKGGQTYISHDNQLVIKASPNSGFDIKKDAGGNPVITLKGENGNVLDVTGKPAGDGYSFSVGLTELLSSNIISSTTPDAAQEIEVLYSFERVPSSVKSFVVETKVEGNGGKITPTQTVTQDADGVASARVYFYPAEAQDGKYWAVDAVTVDGLDAASSDAAKYGDVSSVDLTGKRPNIVFENLTADHTVVVKFKQVSEDPGYDSSTEISGDVGGNGEGTITGGGSDVPVWSGDGDTSNDFDGEGDGDGRDWTAIPKPGKNEDGTYNVVDSVVVNVDGTDFTIYWTDRSQPATGDGFNPHDYVLSPDGLDREGADADGLYTYYYPNKEGATTIFTFDPVTKTVNFLRLGNSVKPQFGIEKARQIQVVIDTGGGEGIATHGGVYSWLVGDSGAEDLMIVITPLEGSDLDYVRLNDSEVPDGWLEDRTESGLSEKGKQTLANAENKNIRVASVTPQVNESRSIAALLSGAEYAYADEAQVKQKLYELTVPSKNLREMTDDLIVHVRFKLMGEDTFTLVASVANDNYGSIVEESVQSVKRGGEFTFHFKPKNESWRVANIVVDGKKQDWNMSSYTFSNVQADHTLVVEFGPVPYSGSNTKASREIRRLQALAKTGDLNAPACTLLMALACGAAGVAVLSGNRSRRRKED